ncbi:MAG TPA: hypothetical protein VFH31_15190, partial [Pyrinomonadaceae bacterium]|nr:hypothetical protein [Pyrinomonadaceae bacterium]
MYKARERRIEIVRRRLLRKSIPRIQVTLILSLTALAGFLVSFILLRLDVIQMWLRYSVAILVAYGVFLVLLALWLWLQRRSRDIDLPDFFPGGSSEPGDSLNFGGSDDFGGAGAGGSWQAEAPSSLSVSSTGGGSHSHSVGLDLDLDEGCLIILAIVALVGGIIASLYIVYIAPVLLAEILVDGALVAGLYKRVKPIEQRHWLRAALRRTLLPALLAMLFFSLAGFALQKVVPDART